MKFMLKKTAKLNIRGYKLNFPRLFEKEKALIANSLKEAEIHHVGSTAVKGLAGKGIIDIMMAVTSWKNEEEVVKKLRQLGFSHVHPKKKGEIFLSTRKRTAIGDFHIHLVKKGSMAYADLLAFRDYMRKHPERVRELSELKYFWWKEAKEDRKKYGRFKGQHVKEILNSAKHENR